MKKKFRALLSEMKKDKSLRVKKSYYTFSREYPAGNIPIKRRKHKRFRSTPIKVFLTAVMFLSLVCISFFAVSVALEISGKEPSYSENQGSEIKENILKAEGIQGLYMPSDKLGDTAYIKDFIKEIRRKNCNSVVIDFKTAEGKLNYSSMLSYAINGKCSVYDNDTVRRALDLFTQKNIEVVARVYCFEDPAVASSSPELSIKYMDTDVSWLDGSDENGGKPWLNPCLGRNQNYLIGVLKELYSLDIRSFILESCCYPDTENTSTATYPGVWNHESKNAALKTFVRRAKASLGEDAYILMSYTAESALDGNAEQFDGYFADAAYDSYTVDLSVRDPAYTVDRKAKFSSMLSLFTLIENKNPDKSFIPVIDISEYSSKYISTIKKSGYTNYIIFDETGEY